MKLIIAFAICASFVAVLLGWLSFDKLAPGVKTPEFKIINVLNSDKLHGTFYVIAEVNDRSLSNINIDFKVDKFSLGTSDILDQPNGTRTMRFPLPTFHFPNGAHKISVVDNRGYHDSRDVVFSNPAGSVRRSGL